MDVQAQAVARPELPVHFFALGARARPHQAVRRMRGKAWYLEQIRAAYALQWKWRRRHFHEL
jgi:hypothetical protein